MILSNFQPAGRQALNYEIAMHKYISFIIED